MRAKTDRISGGASGWRLAMAAGFAIVCIMMAASADETADLILHNGQVITVDKDFSIHEAVAIGDGVILAVGSNDEALALEDGATEVIDLEGKTVLPGLMDSHVHSTGAAVHEFDHTIPEMRNIADVLDYVERRAEILEPGEWIRVSQVFITRLEERRYPTRAELDEAAPENPVVFRTGPDASLNSLALERSGIDADFEEERGLVERDPETGEPTGILRGLNHLVAYEAPEGMESPTHEDRKDHLAELLQDYASVGLTAVMDGNASSGGLNLYTELLEEGRLPVRVAAQHATPGGADPESYREAIANIAEHPLRVDGSDHLRIIGVKTFLDGGMLTGTAYMREPWGVSELYNIDDPEYRGIRNIPHENVVDQIRAAAEHDLQYTAHCQGDAATLGLLEAYAEVNEDIDLAHTRPSITHGSFLSAEAIDLMVELDAVANVQPAWFYLDAATLLNHFGRDRLEYFIPLRSLLEAGVTVGGGSDHMQKIGPRRSVNPYDPWLGIWTTLTRLPRGMDEPLNPDERLSREQALRFYTAHNAYLFFQEDLTGSIEPGKAADIVVIDRDVLTCPVDDILDTEVLQTYVEGELVHHAEE
ncbi:MAG: amidohydrolase [Candidatus Hydrogenedentota bacterium]